MKILSIDVGIKNLAYCLIENSNDEIIILDWCVIDLREEKQKCKYITKGKICNKNALYKKDNECYCKVHSKKIGIIPTEKIVSYKNANLTELLEYCKKYKIKYDKENKTNVKKYISEYLEKYKLDIIDYKSASNMDLIDIGISIMNNLNEKKELIADTIIIENQIGPIANKMKCIQGMIAQYFIMKDIKNIKFISAINKLKNYTTSKLNYSERKKLSIKVTKELLDAPSLVEWIEHFDKSKKQDDLADCFLQGLWYLKKI